MEMLRPGLHPAVLTSAAIASTRDGAPVSVAGMVVARQRPATAKGIVFMLLEDERGVINLIVPPPVVERHRLAVRTSGFVVASGKLEHREGTTNVLVGKIERLERTGMPAVEGGRRPSPPLRVQSAGTGCLGTGRGAAGAAQLRAPRAVMQDFPANEHLPSEAERRFLFMKTTITDIRERLCDGADLVVDFATLGEYGYQASPPPARSAGRSRRSRMGDECLPATTSRTCTSRQTTALQRRAARLERFAA